MQIEEQVDGILITTTDIHLPRRIGEALHRAYQGEIEAPSMYIGSERYSPPAIAPPVARPPCRLRSRTRQGLGWQRRPSSSAWSSTLGLVRARYPAPAMTGR
jgi:hypothetical protein